MNKKEYEEWVVKAEEALQSSDLFKDTAHQKILKSYNGQVGALGISILMSGLIPTLAIYYQHQTENNNGACRKNVLEVIARMMNYENARTLLETALDLDRQKKATLDLEDNEILLNGLEKQRKQLQDTIIDCSVALKQVVRTYKLVE